MRQRTGQGERRLVLLLGLLRVAQQPQHQGHKGEAKYPRVVQDGTGVAVLGIIEGATQCQVLLGQDKLTEVLKPLPERPMCLHEECRIANALGQAEQPLP
jgi:hypothetical protein